MTVQSHSDLTPKWQRPSSNSADPYRCKILKNHPLGTHHPVKKGYTAQ